jgi:hypothetical protein
MPLGLWRRLAPCVSTAYSGNPVISVPVATWLAVLSLSRQKQKCLSAPHKKLSRHIFCKRNHYHSTATVATTTAPGSPADPLMSPIAQRPPGCTSSGLSSGHAGKETARIM